MTDINGAGHLGHASSSSAMYADLTAGRGWDRRTCCRLANPAGRLRSPAHR